MWKVKRTTMRDAQGVLREDYALMGTVRGKPVALRLEWVPLDRRQKVAERLAERLNAAPETMRVPVLRLEADAASEPEHVRP